MPGSEYLFKGFTFAGEALLNEELEFGVSNWVSYALLAAGSFYNVTLNDSGAYGGRYDRLRCSEDPYYAKGRVWEGVRRDWIWESGVPSTAQPIQVSGVYVNSTFYPLSTSGAYAHHVNYPLGRVVFDSAIPASAVVACEHSFRFWQVHTGNVPWFKELQFASFRPDDPQFLQYGSGAWGVLAHNRVQLPAMVGECIPHRTSVGLALGGGRRVRQDMLFHIFAEHPYDMKWGADALLYSHDKTFMLPDENQLRDNNRYPLDYRGMIASGALSFPDQAGLYPWKKVTFADARWEGGRNEPPLYYSIVKLVCEVDLPNI